MDLRAAIREDEALSSKVRNPQAGQPIHRGEVRHFDNSMRRITGEGWREADQVARQITSSDVEGANVPAIGAHWSAVTSGAREFARGRDSRDPSYAYGDDIPSRANMVWHGELAGPSTVAEKKNLSNYGAGHWEREIELGDESPVKLTGATVSFPSPDKDPWDAPQHEVTFDPPRYALASRYGGRLTVPRKVPKLGSDTFAVDRAQRAYRNIKATGLSQQFEPLMRDVQRLGERAASMADYDG